MRFLSKIRVFLVVLALAVGWLSWPALARWNFGAAPAEMTFDAFLAGGARAPSVLLHDVYVDGRNEVKTEMVKSNGQSMGYAGSYFPLRSGADDPRPVKVFLKWQQYTEREGVAVLALPGESSEQFVGRANKMRAGGLQDVAVSRLYGHEVGDDLAKALHSCSLRTEADLVMVEQNLAPMTTLQALGLLAVPPGLLALAALPWWLERRKKAKVPAAGNPA